MTSSRTTRALLVGAAMAATAVITAAPAMASGSGTEADPWYPSHSANITCDSASMFGNYTDGSHDLRNKFATAHAGDDANVSYVTDDRYAVMLIDHSLSGDTKWGFVLRSCVSVS